MKNIFTLIDILIKKCYKDELDYSVSLIKVVSNHIDYEDGQDSYNLSVIAEEEEQFSFKNMVSLDIVMNFGDYPFVCVNYSDDYPKDVRIYDDKINEYRDIITELYERYAEEKIDKIIDRTIDYFDIDNSEIRDVKIENIIK